MKNKLLNHDVSQNRGNALLPPVAFLFHLSIVRPRLFASVCVRKRPLSIYSFCNHW